MYKAVIFDLDGTLLNTIEDLAAACNYALRKNGYNTYQVKKYKEFVGSGIYKLVERAVPKEYRSDKNIEEVFISFKEYYNKNLDVFTKPYDGILELLNKLKSNGVLLGIVSNKADEMTKSIANKYFMDLFHEVYGLREGYLAKPDCKTVNEMLSNLEVNKDEAIYVGDSEIDILTGKNANMKTIGVSWGFRTIDVLKKAGAEIIVNDVKELENEILKK